MTTDISIRKGLKGVDLCSNAPITKIQVIRHFTSKPMLVTRYDQQDDSITINNNISDQGELVKQQRREKREKHLEYLQRLHERLVVNAERKRDAFRVVVEKMQGSQMVESTRAYAPKPLTNKALSSENLTMQEMHPDRTFIVHPVEKYDLNYKNFPPSDNIARHQLIHDAEKELRLRYRAGHLDEIKRKQLGKVYQSTRKYYMDQEKLVLQKQYNASKYTQ